MPSERAARPYRFFAPELGIIVHDFTHQLLDQLLADRTSLVSSATVFAMATITSSASSVSTLSDPPAGARETTPGLSRHGGGPRGATGGNYVRAPRVLATAGQRGAYAQISATGP